MTGFIRRVVTGHDKSGKAIVISDGLAPAVKTNPLRPGYRSTDIWETNAVPAPITIDEPDPTLGPRTIHPVPQGTVIRIAELAPESEEIRNLSPEKAREVFKARGNEAASTFGRGGRHPMMHRTETIDYAVVLDGEITLLLDDVDVQLKMGDVVIQRGTNHAWSNRSGKPCRMLYILIDGRFDPELAALLKTGSGE
ncbi:MAG TPA: cupin domain-containing protein [Acidiferrobacterales bacterium]|nr:cupin domain-containing protein [Acidiferrobacterales bacterium]